MSEPETHRALEFGFTHGDPLFITLIEGRDTCIIRSMEFSISINHPDKIQERVNIERAKLNYWREAVYQVQPESKPQPWAEPEAAL
jgi:hypothetical protein